MKTAVFSLLTVFAVLFSLEVLMRLIEPFFPSVLLNDPHIGLSVNPRVPSTNSLGFNDGEFSELKQPGVFRVVALGDSFNWAGGLRGNYWSLAEEMLRKKIPDARIEIYNQGVICTGLLGYKKMLQHVSLRYAPDSVGMGFYVGNDFLDDNPDAVSYTRFGIPTSSPSREKELFNAYRDSYLWFFLKTRWTLWLNGWERRKNGLDALDPNGLSPKGFMKLERSKLTILEPAFYDSSSWRRTQSRILEIRDILRERNISFFMVLIPEEFQVSPSLWDSIFERYPDLDKTAYDRQMPQKVLCPFLRENGIPYVNVLEVFTAQKESSRESFYTPIDTHFNERGNQLAAQAVSEYLAREIDPASAAVTSV